MRLLGLLAALVLGTPAAPLLAAGASGQPKLSGTVRAAHASAVHGATVYATELRTGIIVSTHTGPDGRFSIPLREPGDYSLSASAKGYRAGDARSVRVEREPRDAGTLALTLEPVVPADQLTSADIIPRLPGLDTPGGRRVSQSCSQCHSISALLWRGGRFDADHAPLAQRQAGRRFGEVRAQADALDLAEGFVQQPPLLVAIEAQHRGLDILDACGPSFG